jgi:hypothetical protein
MYHSHHSEVNDTNAGLVGPIIVTRKGMAKSTDDPSPSDVDREFVTLSAVFDENKAVYHRANLESKLPNFAGNDAALTAAQKESLRYQLLKDEQYKLSNKMHTVNGKVFCSLRGLQFKETDKVRWHAMSLGDEVPHAPAWEGLTFSDHGHRSAALGLMAASMKSVDVAGRPVPGIWLFNDPVTEHLDAGLKALFTVTDVDWDFIPSEVVKTYFIGADEVEWDYTPSGQAQCADTNHVAHLAGAFAAQVASGFEPAEALYLRPGHHRIGSKYIKAQYRQYGDEDFDKLQMGHTSRFNSISEHLGLQGPVLEGTEGDVLEVQFWNRLRFPCNFYVRGGVRSVGPHDPTTAVPPGAKRTFRFHLTAASAPEQTANEGDTAVYSYQSMVDIATARRTADASEAPRALEAAVANFAGHDAGLFGALLVRRKESDTWSGSEIVTVFQTTDENRSPYLHMNTLKFAGSGATADKADPVFKASNKMHNINGRSFCNLGGLELLRDKKARWYQLVLGGLEDVHAPVMHGQSLDVWGSHVPATQLMPGQSRASEFTPAYPGKWLLQSATVASAHSGMQAMVEVADRVG